MNTVWSNGRSSWTKITSNESPWKRKYSTDIGIFKSLYETDRVEGEDADNYNTWK